ncbi:MAG: Gfo/Idh/MocA family oxidoreductase [Geminicoccaceae bacterium]|nr:Gfo/Idh/MocA family oxidoreductase [Geminicoccaceae bacterium]
MSGLRGAVIGCGFFAQNHLKAWRDVEGARIVAVCDLDPARAEAAAALTGARAHSDAASMFAEEKPDFVDIATTMEIHEPLARLAARHDVAVICQKPFAPDIETVRRILGFTRRPIMVHENFRFQRPLIELERHVRAGAVGTPFFAHISWRTGYDVVAGQPYLAEVERFIILDLGIHLLDVARFLLGDVADIHCRTRRTMPGAKGEASAVLSLRHLSGAVSQIVCSYTTRIEPDPFPQTLIELEGDRGSLHLRHDYRLEHHERGRMTVHDVAPRPPAWADPQWALVQESVLNTQQHWIDCLRSGREPQTSGADNLKTFALVEAAYASAASGRAEVPEA